MGDDVDDSSLESSKSTKTAVRDSGTKLGLERTLKEAVSSPYCTEIIENT